MVTLPTGVHQANLENALRSIFPTSNVLYNARKDIQIINPQTGKCMEVDVWLPDIQLGFEFQDEHHYKATNYAHSPLSYYQQKDTTKQGLLQERKVTLIVVPYWWDMGLESLQATITFQRPDIDLPASDELIPLNPPLTSSFYDTQIPDAGELMLASFPVSLDIFSENHWWIGEKYDGVRCCWNPRKKQLYSRTGVVLLFPHVLSKLMLPVFIDAEIWTGRGNYVEAFQAIRSKQYSPDLRLIGFDLSSPEHQTLPVEKRYARLSDHIPPLHPFIILPSRMRNKSSKFVIKILQRLIQQNSEGIIIQKIKSLYVRGRSEYLWKLKAIQGDQEALITKVDEFMNISVKLPNGQEFRITPSHYSLHRPPRNGDIVTIAFEEQSRRDEPTNARAVRLRGDLTWDDVLNSFHSEQKFIGQQKIQDFTTRPAGFWSKSKMRGTLEALILGMELDPLVPHSWYGLVGKEALKTNKDVRSVITKFGGSLIRAIEELFPEVKIEKKRFAFGPSKYYHEVANRRKLFENFAIEKKIDPRKPSNWYPFSVKDFRNIKGVHALVWRYYDGNLGKALLHLFPNIGLNLSLFEDYGNWKDKRRRLFLDFARINKFDPLVATNWYTLSVKDLFKIEGAHYMLRQHYEGKLSNALVHLFPDIGIDEAQFDTMRRKNFLKTGEHKNKAPGHFYFYESPH